MPIISVSSLTKSFKTLKKAPGFKGSLTSLFKREYKKKFAVNDISFNIEQGELIGFIGPNGAGKTTTLKMLSGLLYPSSGSVQVLGHEPFKRETTFLKQISLVMGQKNQLWWDLPAQESFMLNKEIYEVSAIDYKSRLNELVELLDAKDTLDTPVRNLSLGQRMKCELIASLLHQPKVLFLDEPTIGLDVVIQKKLREFIKDYNQKHQATIILTSHYMEDVRQLCERLIIINNGGIVYDGKTDDIIKKYARNKIITIIFSKKIEKEDLEKFGKIKEYDGLSATVYVPIANSNEVAAHLLEKYPVEDLNIIEPNLEDIIREFFERQ